VPQPHCITCVVEKIMLTKPRNYTDSFYYRNIFKKYDHAFTFIDILSYKCTPKEMWHNSYVDSVWYAVCCIVNKKIMIL
jgi:hypothetical protein